MILAIVGLSTHPESGSWTARKAIPAVVRAAYRSPFDGDPKWEEKRTWPSALSKGQAKAELAAWLVPIEKPIYTLRKAARKVPLTLSQRQARALADEWYAAKVAQRYDDPGDELDWMFSASATEPRIGPDGKPGKPSVAVSITQLFEDDVATGVAAPATVKKWTPVI
jgi:hypothetical protein